MKISREQKSDFLVKLKIEVSENEFQKFRKKSLDEFSQNSKVAGFRAGKIPEKVLIEKHGETAIDARAIEFCIDVKFFNAVRDENLHILNSPKIEIEKKSPLIFTAEFQILPEFTPPKLDEIKFEKIGEIEISKKEIDETRKQICEKHATLKKVDRAAKTGDLVEIDFDGFDEKNVPLAGTSSKHHPVLIGQKTFIPGFEEKLIGAKSGDKKEFELTFPKDYHREDFQNKKVKFVIFVHDVFEKIIPEITDEFAAQLLGAGATAEKFENEIVEGLKIKKRQEILREKEENFLQNLSAKCKFEIPPILIERETENSLQNLKQNLAAQKIEFEKYLQNLKTDEKTLRQNLEKSAREKVKKQIAFSRFLQTQKIEIDEKKVAEISAEKIATAPSDQKKEAKKHFKKLGAGWNEIENTLKVDQFFRGIFEN